MFLKASVYIYFCYMILHTFSHLSRLSPAILFDILKATIGKAEAPVGHYCIGRVEGEPSKTVVLNP